jgi:hypothetical protein
MISKSIKTAWHLVLVGALFALTGLAGCREQEENRPIKLEKGQYEGKEDPGLSDAQRRELRFRGERQKF